jgi:hypothetical protein
MNSLRRPRLRPFARLRPLAVLAAGLLFGLTAAADAKQPLTISTFDLDVTPPIGTMMAYDPVKRVEELGLRCRGIVITGAEAPVAVCAFDWIGIANEGHDAFRAAIARGAGTTPERVAVHCLHQHDAPRCDFSAEQLLHHAGVTDLGSHESSFQRGVLAKLEQAVRASLDQTVTITHAGFGSAEVKQVASNRRLLGEDGKVWGTRYTACRDPKMRAEPEGVIDPDLDCLVFYHEQTPVASLTYYACHPQSYYRTGIPSPDFPGIARIFRSQDVPEALHIHFNGAGGNIGAGKYNDGSKDNRLVLAERVADGMRRAFESVKRFPVDADSLGWKVVPVALPPAPHLDRQALEAAMEDPAKAKSAASNLAWLSRCESGHKIELSCLSLGDVRVLHMPGELFVEFQLAAKAMRPDLQVTMAAYGDYGTGYIGTEIAYSQGGYETSQRASRVDKSGEAVLIAGMRQLLDATE